MQDLVVSIIRVFVKAIYLEMEAMRCQLGSFEVSLLNGEKLPEGNEGRFRYRFRLTEKNDKLMGGMECSLRFGENETLAAVSDVTGSTLDLECSVSLPLGDERFILVIYPWFLYERLIRSLEQLPDSQSNFIRNSLMVFGKKTPIYHPEELRLAHKELNSSQLQAVELCVNSNLAFVWGPPGTGKTTTLGHIVTELL